jgi:hypothetical protein
MAVILGNLITLILQRLMHVPHTLERVNLGLKNHPVIWLTQKVIAASL